MATSTFDRDNESRSLQKCVLDETLLRLRALDLFPEVRYVQHESRSNQVAEALVVLLNGLRESEWILLTLSDVEAFQEKLAGAVAAGWHVTAVVPQEFIGQAKRTLRSIPLRMQGWWIREDRLIFDAPIST